MAHILYNNTEIPLHYPLSEPSGTVTVYAVPTEYSPDGLYMAAWGAADLEPVPASVTEKTMLLGRFAVTLTDGEPVFDPVTLAEGVSYEN